VLCGRLFVAPMRGISFGVSKRMHPTEWENLTIDRQTDTEGAKKVSVVTNGQEFGKNEL